MQLFFGVGLPSGVEQVLKLVEFVVELIELIDLSCGGCSRHGRVALTQRKGPRGGFFRGSVPEGGRVEGLLGGAL